MKKYIVYLKKNIVWILFFGTLIGLNETFLVNLHLYSRSIILTMITLTLLSFSRRKMPKPGISLLIIVIAILFKINNLGIYNCNKSTLLCGPASLLILGVSYEIFANNFIDKKTFHITDFIITCGLTSYAAFSIFGFLNTYILQVWDTIALFEYVFVKATITIIASSILISAGLYMSKRLRSNLLSTLRPLYSKGAISIVIIAAWLIGSLVN